MTENVNNMQPATFTVVYLVRHAQADGSVADDYIRPLTPAGSERAEQLVDYLKPIHFDAFYSSPYRRAIDTLAPLAAHRGLPIQPVEDLRERSSGNEPTDFASYTASSWADFNFKAPGGESLLEVQRRNIAVLEEIISRHGGQTLAIGTHGTAVSSILNYYDPSFGHAQYEALLPKSPCVFRLTFEGGSFAGLEEIPLL